MKRTGHQLCTMMLVVGLSAPAAAQFVEDDVEVLRFFQGDAVGDNFGWVSDSIEDITGDGVRDLIIPAIRSPGRVLVYSGASGDLVADLSGVVAHGYSVSRAGDVNADGVPDYIGGGFPVAVYSGADNSVLLDLTATTGFGHSVAGAGDIDGDGYSDIIVGSERILNVSENGRVFVISGRTGTVIWQRDGATDSNLGSAVGTLGDVNYDGIPDVIVGAQSAGANGGGEAYVYDGRDGTLIHTLRPSDPAQAKVFGQFFASGASDVDADGVGDAFVGDYSGLGGAGETYIFSGKTGALIHRFAGIDTDDGFGPGRGIPDVNGDGHADIFIGAYTDSDGAPGAGKAYLYSGRSGALLRTITSTDQGAQFGVDAIAVGDVNHDGLTDFLVTAVGKSFAGTGPGEAYLIAGTRLPCVADLNGNGRVGVFDMIRLFKFSRRGNLQGDLNGDRTVDQADFDVLFADWGRCPKTKKNKKKW